MSFVKHITFYAMLILLTACPWQKKDSPEPAEANISTPAPPSQPAPTPAPVPAPPILTTINILVFDQHYQAIENATITLSNSQTSLTKTSNKQGQVKFEIDYANFSFPTQLTSQKIGYTNQVKIIDDLIEQGDNQFQLAMLKREPPITMNANSTISLITKQGASLLLPPNSLVNQQGNIVNGDVDIYITPLDISQENGLSLFPGEFLGTKINDTPQPILSYGTTEFHFEQNNQELQLAQGIMAQIELPIYAELHPNDQPIQIDDRIDLWHLNEQSGLWKNYNQGIVVHSKGSPTSYALRASVPHFSWWNTDVAPVTRTIGFNINGDFTGQCRVQVNAVAGSSRSPRSRASSLVTVPSSRTYTVPDKTVINFSASLNTNGQVYFANKTVRIDADTTDISLDLLPAGLTDSSTPKPYIYKNFATVSPVFKIDGTDNTYIHDSNKISYFWQVLLGKPRQSGCTNVDSTDNNAISIKLTTNAKRYTDVTLEDSQGQLDLFVDNTDTLDLSGQLINKDPDPIALTLTATNSPWQSNQTYRSPE